MMRSLTVQTTQALMMGLLAVLLAQAAFIGYYNRNLMMQTAQDKIRTIMAAQADNVAVALWNLDFEQMQAQVAGLMEAKTILGAQIVSSSSKAGEPLIAAGEVFTTEQPREVVSVPIVFFNKETETKREIGRLDLMVDYSPVEEQIRRLILIIVSVTSLVFGAVGFLVYSVVKRAVSPVNKLSTLMSHGDALHRPLHELDEISSKTREVSQLVMAFKLLQGQFFESKEELIKAKEEAEATRAFAERANRAKTEFLANMSHELRTPLNSVIGLTQMLKESESSEERIQMFNTVELSSQNLLSIVNDVLDISKIESSNFQFESVPFNAYNNLQNVVRALRFLAQKHNLVLQANITIDPALNVMGDPKHFTQISTNLLANAIKYTEKGSVTFSARQEEADDGRVNIVVCVKDTGIGIPADRLDSIFEKFVQADASTTRKYGGSGLGLSITKNLTEMMGGKISVESVLGEGSAFTVCIPFEVTTQAPVQLENAEVEKKHTGTLPAAAARILVAEDHELNQFFMRKLLPSIGLHNFQIVENGQLALDAAREGAANIILMDCHMPVLNGYDATLAIRKIEQEKGGHIPIIAMTANALEGERENCLNHGMDEYMSKPLDRQKLVNTLSRWIAFDAPSEPIARPEEKKQIILDMTSIRSLSQGDAETEKELMGIFLTQSTSLIGKLSQLCVGGSCKEWSEIAHTLKGSTATVGAFALNELCVQAQDMTDETTAAERLELLNRIMAAHREVVREMAEHGFVIEIAS